ncbi:hypothetical protein ONZ43_g4387 [Nemania bipapillata]|uniref:Uncharacterized protein n=1 Tax=Nemania bipapillata TaxID=110536 RepID=A0ACC2INQ5_9PEZI|nr:hypothetical protein ONZ43_g4387 [Nemania bipapillata]
MARPLFHNIFFRLPPATAVLLLSVVFDRTNGHALPRQTKIVQFHELDVIPFPPLPTGEPLSPSDLRLRQENTVCGYLGGSLDFPATCSLGSHCVLDAVNSVVGCCPNGGPCTTGVFTGCVDRNSDPQTEINPYVYTCQGTNHVLEDTLKFVDIINAINVVDLLKYHTKLDDHPTNVDDNGESRIGEGQPDWRYHWRARANASSTTDNTIFQLNTTSWTNLCTATRMSHSHPQPPDLYGPLEPTRSASPGYRTYSNPHPPEHYGPLESTLSAPAPANLGSTAYGFSQPLRYNQGYMPVGMPQPKGSLTPVAEEVADEANHDHDQPVEGIRENHEDASLV